MEKSFSLGRKSENCVIIPERLPQQEIIHLGFDNGDLIDTECAYEKLDFSVVSGKN